MYFPDEFNLKKSLLSVIRSEVYHVLQIMLQFLFNDGQGYSQNFTIGSIYYMKRVGKLSKTEFTLPPPFTCIIV